MKTAGIVLAQAVLGLLLGIAVTAIICCLYTLLVDHVDPTRGIFIIYFILWFPAAAIIGLMLGGLAGCFKAYLANAEEKNSARRGSDQTLK